MSSVIVDPQFLWDENPAISELIKILLYRVLPGFAPISSKEGEGRERQTERRRESRQALKD